MSEITKVVHSEGFGAWIGLRPVLALEFGRSGLPPKRWRIPRVPPRQARGLGSGLAEVLGVPFE